MASRAEAFAAYTKDIYAQYDALVDSVAADSRIELGASDGILDFSQLDVESAVMLMFSMIAADAEQDLRDIMAEMQAAQQAKERLREAQQRLKDQLKDFEDDAADDERINGGVSRFDPCAVVDTDLAIQLMIMVAAKRSTDELQALADEVIVLRERRKRANKRNTSPDDLDRLSELSELEALRLQMAMDRLSKMMSTLSNLLKKMSETQDAIIQNLK